MLRGALPATAPESSSRGLRCLPGTALTVEILVHKATWRNPASTAYVHHVRYVQSRLAVALDYPNIRSIVDSRIEPWYVHTARSAT